jgi:predicted amino acid dehydrogenase
MASVLTAFFARVLLAHEVWIALQHLNIWLNPWVQSLDRNYGLELIKRNQHPVITVVLGEYWLREIVTMLMHFYRVRIITPRILLAASIVYHLWKVSSLFHDGVHRSSSRSGIVYTLLSPLTTKTSGEARRTVIRLSLQGFDSLVHCTVAYAMAVELGFRIPAAVTLAWLYHQATVYHTKRSTATRPVERARRHFHPGINPHEREFALNEDVERLLRPLDGDTKVDVVLLAHPLGSCDAASCASSVSEIFVNKSNSLVFYIVSSLLLALFYAQSVVIHFLWEDPVVLDRFVNKDGLCIETWSLPAFPYHYYLFPGVCERKIQTSVRRASDRGAKRVILAGLNKASTVGNGGLSLASKINPQELQLDDGNLLTTAVLNYHIKKHIGTERRFRVVGSTSKIGSAIVRYWTSRGVVVECVSSCSNRVRRLRDELNESSRGNMVALGPNDTRPMSPPILWIFCGGGEHDLHPDTIVLTVALPRPTFKGRPPRRVIDAGLVVYKNGSPFNFNLGLETGTMYPCLATGTIPPLPLFGKEPEHSVGRVDHTLLDQIFDHADKHGVIPLEYEHDALVVGSGFGGLLASKYLNIIGGIDSLVLSGDEDFGGSWLHVDASETLMTHPRHLKLPTRCIPSGDKRWTASDVRSFLQETVRPTSFILNDPVASIGREQGVFVVETQKGRRHSNCHTSLNIVIATGRSRKLIGLPRSRRFPERCFSLGHPQAIPSTGARVLILGLGNSSLDLYRTLRSNSCEVRFSVRSCPVI